MAIKKGFSVATGLVKDDNGYTTGLIGEISEETITRQNQTARGEIDETEQTVFTVPVMCETTGTKPITIKLMLGTKVNPEPLDTIRKGSKQVKVYNKLTTFLMNTGCLSVSDLDDLTGEKLEGVFSSFEKLHGVKIRFKSEKNKANFNDILISTIEVVKD